jgi:putative ABC transport system permease protein
MSPLNHKLMRDLWRIRGQALAIAAVIATGVLLMVMMAGLVTSLQETKRAYYDRYRMADVFAPVARAPERLLSELAGIEGVSGVQGRITGNALVDIADQTRPVRATVVSLPESGVARLNTTYLVSGRMLAADRVDEVLVLARFASALGFEPGDRLDVTLNGARRSFTIAGLVQSPEYLYAVAPGELVTDAARFAVLWMSEPTLAASFDMSGAFNEAVLSLTRSANLARVLDEIDALLERYGGLGAYGVAEQVSNRFVSDEISSLATSGRTVPPVFLLVAAFLLYIVISRIVTAEREEIGLLKAFGYSNAEVGFHYLKLVLLIAVAGALAGAVAGIVAGRSMVELYLQYFNFPLLVFRLDPGSFLISVGVSVLAASAGGVLVLRKVVALNPAAAMRPPVPQDFSAAAQIAPFVSRFLDQPSRMVLRRLARQPMQMLGAMTGIAAGTALTVAMISLLSGFDRLIAESFGIVDRSDLTVTFTRPVSETALFELATLPGVIDLEPVLYVPAVLSNGLRRYREPVTGLTELPRLNRALDGRLRPIAMRKDGLILSKSLARVLDVRPGDQVHIDVREGSQPQIRLPVVAIADTLLGAPAYMDIAALNRALGQGEQLSVAYLRVDTRRLDALFDHLNAMPLVAGAQLKADTQAAYQTQMDSGAGAMRFVMLLVASVITFGIVYNAARIAFAERMRELASLQVIGFTRAEVAFVLFGELAAVTLLALPLGLTAGHFLSSVIAAGFSTDMYQIPASTTPAGLGWAALAVLISAAVSAWVVKRDINQMDLVSTLKTKE